VYDTAFLRQRRLCIPTDKVIMSDIAATQLAAAKTEIARLQRQVQGQGEALSGRPSQGFSRPTIPPGYGYLGGNDGNLNRHYSGEDFVPYGRRDGGGTMYGPKYGLNGPDHARS
jgi:hypothetical protein